MLRDASPFATIARMHSVAFSLPDDTDQLKAEVVKLRGAVKENEQTITDKERRI